MQQIGSTSLHLDCQGLTSTLLRLDVSNRYKFEWSQGNSMLKYVDLKAMPSQFLVITGVPSDEFDKYLPKFTEAYDELYSLANANLQNTLTQIEDKLLFIWMSHQVQTVSSELMLQFEMNKTQVNYCVEHLSPVMRLTLSKLTSTNLSQSCARFLQLLNTYQVEYLVVGGYAVAFYGYLRPILDFDIFIATNPLNAQKMKEVLHAFGRGVAPSAAECFQLKERVIRIGQPPFAVEKSALRSRFIQFGTSPIQLEVLTSISAITFEECYPKRVGGTIDGVAVQVIGLEQLKINKKASIREKDADDLVHLNFR